MEKLIMNDNWELERVEDTSDLFLLVVEQNAPACSYVHKYDVSPETLQADYSQLVGQYTDTATDGALKLYIIQVPNTPQVHNCVCCCDSMEKGSTEEAIDAINHLLNRADCEILESWNKQALVEKKAHKRKRRKGSGGYLTFTTGYPELNDKFFNDRFGTSDLGCESGCETGASDGGFTESLLENEDEPHRQGERGRVPGKRYIKRYYIRPQNIFCSKKSDILQALVKDVGEENCSVYSLKSLADHDDVHLLQPSDIIYYYDDGILYDKNHVKVMDYDLNVKHEEERKKFSDVNAVADATFDAEYDDRLTEGAKPSGTCCICGEEFEGYGNNPSPVTDEGRCCDACNLKFVIPARIELLDEGDD